MYKYICTNKIGGNSDVYRLGCIICDVKKLMIKSLI